MIINETKKIVSCDDFELEIKRDTELEYSISYPSDIKPKAIVFIIPGCGGDTNNDYMNNLREYVANTFSVVAVNVFYHCFYSRPENGATLSFDDFDINYLKAVIEKFKIDFSDVSEITKETILKKLHEVDKEMTISMTLVPKKDEYQNFGVMQAIDHLNVLKELHKTFIDTHELPVVCFGSSHGGYIAQMMAKFAPNSISHVVDNSSYVRPALHFILGKEINVNRPEYTQYFDKLRVNCFVQTYWTLDANSPYCYSQDRDTIRDVSNLEHIKVMSNASQDKTQYTLYHSEHDTVALIQEKKILCENLIANGYKVVLHTFSKEEDIDGKLIKNLKHGMDMSIKELINRELPSILQSATSIQRREENLVMEYVCNTVTYSLDIQKSIYKIS